MECFSSSLMSSGRESRGTGGGAFTTNLDNRRASLAFLSTEPTLPVYNITT